MNPLTTLHILTLHVLWDHTSKNCFLEFYFLRHCRRRVGKVTCKHYLNDFSFTFIELPKFPKTKEDQLENIVEKWCYFFRYAAETREEDLDKIVGSNVIIKRAYEEMNKLSWSEEELLAYEQEKKRLMDEMAANKI